MKNFIIAFVVFLIWSFFGLWIYSWIQPEENSLESRNGIIENNTLDSLNFILKNNTNIKTDSLPVVFINKDTIVENEIPSEEIKNYFGLKALSDNGDIIFMFSEGISIKKDNSKVFIPQTAIDYKYKLYDYLNEHTDQELHIYSLYSPAENIESPNLGIQRGQKIKDQLISIGSPSYRIVIKSIIKDISFDADGTYYNNISFIFMPLDNKRIVLLKEKVPENKIVYLEFNNSGLAENEALKNLLREIITFNKINPKFKIKIIGHTDNIGNSTDNYTTALSYARQVRWYLISKGNLDRKQITASSRGESQPIADNNTKRGRNTNSRIEVIYN